MVRIIRCSESVAKELGEEVWGWASLPQAARTTRKEKKVRVKRERAVVRMEPVRPQVVTVGRLVASL